MRSAWEQPVSGADWSAKAENDLSAKQYYLLELSAADQVDVCDGAGDLVVGVLQNKPKAGDPAAIRSYGVSKCIAGGTVAAGDRIGTNASGKGVAKTVDADLVIGIALTAAAADEYFALLLTPGAQRAA